MNGVVSGALDNPHFAGQAAITNGIFEGHSFDTLTATMDGDLNKIHFNAFALARGELRRTGKGISRRVTDPLKTLRSMRR